MSCSPWNLNVLENKYIVLLIFGVQIDTERLSLLTNYNILRED